MTSLCYHWNAAEFNVLANNFVVSQPVSKRIGSLASLMVGGYVFRLLLRVQIRQCRGITNVSELIADSGF